jgi:RNA polymerase sigma-70 factor, ECF subfamily
MTVSRVPLGDLLVRSGEGDQASFARFYDATAATVFGLALSISHDPVRAEEVTADVFVAAWASAPGFASADATASQWLADITWATIIAGHVHTSERRAASLSR